MISYRTRRKFGLGDGHRSNDRTVSDTGGEVDGPKATGSFGVNTAVRLWVPVDRVEVFRWAMPPGLTGCGSLSGVVPSVNWMVPAAPWGAAWAMRFTGLPQRTTIAACRKSPPTQPS